jgi:hypothetical protein
MVLPSKFSDKNGGARSGVHFEASEVHQNKRNCLRARGTLGKIASDLSGFKKSKMIISYSFLKAFEQCPFQQKLIRIGKVIPKKIDKRRFIAGSAGHRFFEVWAERGFDDKITPKTVERILYILSKRMNIVWKDEFEYEKVKEKVIKEASMIIETVHQHGIDKLENIEVEKLFTKPLSCNQHSVAGKIDIGDPDQLIFYGLLIGAIQRRYPERLSFFLPVIPNIEARIIDIEFLKDDFRKMYKRIQNLIEAWTKGNFPPASDPEACHFCGVKEYCTFI